MNLSRVTRICRGASARATRLGSGTIRGLGRVYGGGTFSVSVRGLKVSITVNSIVNNESCLAKVTVGGSIKGVICDIAGKVVSGRCGLRKS